MKEEKTSNKKVVLDFLALLIWPILVILLSQFCLSFLFFLFFGENSDSPLLVTLYSAAVYVVSLFLIIFVPKKLLKKWQSDRESLGLSGLPTFTDIGLAPVGFGVYLLLSALLTKIFELFPWFNAAEDQNVGYSFLNGAPERILAFLALALVAPIAEEIIFRGWLYGKLRERVPKKISIPVSIFLVSLIFGLLHGQWNVGINVFAMSVVVCLMREITGTIYSGILLHILKNAVAFYLVFIIGV